MKTRRTQAMKKPYTQLENGSLEALARAPFSSREFRVVLAILRLTNGYHLTENNISIAYLQQLTGIASNHLYETLKSLAQSQVISYVNGGTLACHGPALWTFPPKASPSPEVGLSTEPPGRGGDSPDLGPKESRLGTNLVPTWDQKPKAEPASSQIVASKENSLKKTPKENKDAQRPVRRASATSSKVPPDSRVKEVLASVQQEQGYPIVNWGKEGAAVKRALRLEYTPQQVIECWRRMKGFAFWRGKVLPMATVAANLGEFVAGTLTEYPGAGRPPARRVEARTDPHDFDEPEDA